MVNERPVLLERGINILAPKVPATQVWVYTFFTIFYGVLGLPSCYYDNGNGRSSWISQNFAFVLEVTFLAFSDLTDYSSHGFSVKNI